jgi:hypothetical protein
LFAANKCKGHGKETAEGVSNNVHWIRHDIDFDLIEPFSQRGFVIDEELAVFGRVVDISNKSVSTGRESLWVRGKRIS